MWREETGSEPEPRADTATTGLAILAFLASGHTHQSGLYHEQVHRGLAFLLNSQVSNGSLGGQASTYARMYCHAIATLALSEAYGMTHDERLRVPLQRAVAYSTSAQDPIRAAGDTTGRPRRHKSVGLAGHGIDQRRFGRGAGARRDLARARRFLASVSHGDHLAPPIARPNESVAR